MCVYLLLSIRPLCLARLCSLIMAAELCFITCKKRGRKPPKKGQKVIAKPQTRCQKWQKEQKQQQQQNEKKEAEAIVGRATQLLKWHSNKAAVGQTNSSRKKEEEEENTSNEIMKCAAETCKEGASKCRLISEL